jgi:hypothetical protein
MNSEENDRITAALAITQLSQSLQKDSDTTNANAHTLAFFGDFNGALAENKSNKNDSVINAFSKSEVFQLAPNSGQLMISMSSAYDYGTMPVLVLQQQMSPAANEVVNMPAVLDTELIENGNGHGIKKNNSIKRHVDGEVKHSGKGKDLKKLYKGVVPPNSNADLVGSASPALAANALSAEPPTQTLAIVTTSGLLNTQMHNDSPSLINVIQRSQCRALNAFSQSVQSQTITSYGLSRVMLPHAHLVHPSNTGSAIPQVTNGSQLIRLPHKSEMPTLLRSKIFAENVFNSKSEHCASLPTSPVPNDSMIIDEPRPASAGCVSTPLKPISGTQYQQKSIKRQSFVLLPPKKRRIVGSDGTELRSESPLLQANGLNAPTQPADDESSSTLLQIIPKSEHEQGEYCYYFEHMILHKNCFNWASQCIVFAQLCLYV